MTTLPASEETVPATDAEIKRWASQCDDWDDCWSDRIVLALIARIKIEREKAVIECAEIARKISDDGHYYGDSSVDTASSIYRQGAFEVYETLLSLVDGDAK